jgi:hypothetical protein
VVPNKVDLSRAGVLVHEAAHCAGAHLSPEVYGDANVRQQVVDDASQRYDLPGYSSLPDAILNAENYLFYATVLYLR